MRKKWHNYFRVEKYMYLILRRKNWPCCTNAEASAETLNNCHLLFSNHIKTLLRTPKHQDTVHFWYGNQRPVFSGSRLKKPGCKQTS